MYIKESNIEAEGLEEYFVVSRVENGLELQTELKPDGKKTRITQANKAEYLDLRYAFEPHLYRVKHMCYVSVIKQLEALKSGFQSVIPKHLLMCLNAEELEQLICGKSVIDLVDWQKNTEYNKPYSDKHKVITWFWKALAVYSQEDLAVFIQFCTGTSRIPIGGFGALESNRGELARFTIHSIPYHCKESPYPLAHTCFNRLILPLYPSYQELKKRLDFIVRNEVIGFGID